MSKARRNRLLKAQAEHKGEARQARRRRWKRLFPRTIPRTIHPHVRGMPYTLTSEEWARMVRTQNETQN